MERALRILLVDDELDFLDATSRRLLRRGFEVKTAARCAEAMPQILAGWPDAVVLDVMLPDANGLECLAAIKDASPGLPVVMLTAHASLHTGIAGIERGASDYCLKPIDLDELVEKIRIALRESRP